MCELEPELRGGAEAGEEDVLQVDVGRLEGAVVEQRRETVGEHVARPTCETEIDSRFLSESKSKVCEQMRHHTLLIVFSISVIEVNCL